MRAAAVRAVAAKRARAEARAAQEAALAAAVAGGGPRLAVECSFDADSDMRLSLMKQLQLAYAAVRAAGLPVPLHLCGLSPAFAADLDRLHAARPWLVVRDPQPAHLVFPRHRLLVLSPDSPDCLPPALDAAADTVFLVCGIVDRTRRPGESLRYATAHGLRHARLPLRETLALQHRRQLAGYVLNIDVVVQMLLTMLEPGGTWQAAVSHIPSRLVNLYRLGDTATATVTAAAAASASVASAATVAVTTVAPSAKSPAHSDGDAAATAVENAPEVAPMTNPSTTTTMDNIIGFIDEQEREKQQEEQQKGEPPERARPAADPSARPAAPPEEPPPQNRPFITS